MNNSQGPEFEFENTSNPFEALGLPADPAITICGVRFYMRRVFAGRVFERGVRGAASSGPQEKWKRIIGEG